MDTDRPDVSEVSLEDCWFPLSHLTRWHGSTRSPYTVADHLLDGLPKAERAGVGAWWLCHELAEAFIGDIPSPLRSRRYDQREDRLLRKLLERFGISEWPMPPAVKSIDKRMAATEAKQLLHPAAWRALALEAKPYRGVELVHRPPAAARRELSAAARAHGLVWPVNLLTSFGGIYRPNSRTSLHRWNPHNVQSASEIRFLCNF